MTPVTATRKARPKKSKAKGRAPWWGTGPAPAAAWPGVTIDIAATWSSARKRWESHYGKYYFDAAAADRACGFFPGMLVHHIGEFAGRPFDLMDYQVKLLTRPIFGWKRAADGFRRFRKLFAFIPKANGKSPFVSGTGLYCLLCDDEPAAEVYALANDKPQARVVHENAKIMVEQSPELMDLCEILKDSIYVPATRSFYQVLSADATTKHGFRPHVAIFDEFHGQSNRDLYEAIKKSMVKRRQPLMLIVTHAGDDDEGICVAPATRLLTDDLRWVSAGDVRVGDVLAGFEETRGGSAHREWRSSRVLASSTARLPSYRLEWDDGTTVTCSEQHMWLVQTAGRRIGWKATRDIVPTDEFFKVLDVWTDDESRGGGYLAALLDSEGHLSATERAHMLCGFSQKVNEVSAFGERLLDERGIRYGKYGGKHGVFQTMVTRKRDVLRMLGSIRPPRLLRRFKEIGWSHLRFKSFAHPKLVKKEPVGLQDVIGLKTTTRTYVAEGLASHNCYEEYEYAKGVLSGTNPDETCLPVIFEMAPKDDWTNPKVWAAVNPGYGVTVKIEGIAQECAEAQAEPRKLNDFLRFHGNRWVNQATAWIPVDWWDACAAPMPSDEELRQYPCAIGIDMAQKIDLAAVDLVFRLPLDRKDAGPDTVDVIAETETGELVKRQNRLDYRIAIVPAFWLPEETLRERVKNDRVPYDRWEKQGLLFTVDGAIVTSAPLVRYIVGRPGAPGLMDRFPLVKEAQVAFDPAFASEVAIALRDSHHMTVVEVLQNYKQLSEACYVFEALVKAGRVIHGGHRLLRWNLENVAVKRDDAGRIRPVKPKKATKRIDGIVAALIALTRLMLMEADKDGEADRDFGSRGLFL